MQLVKEVLERNSYLIVRHSLPLHVGQFLLHGAGDGDSIGLAPHALQGVDVPTKVNLPILSLGLTLGYSRLEGVGASGGGFHRDQELGLHIVILINNNAIY